MSKQVTDVISQLYSSEVDFTVLTFLSNSGETYSSLIGQRLIG